MLYKYFMTFDHDNEIIEYEVPWYLEQMGLYTPNKTNEEDNDTTQEQTNTIENSNNINQNTIENNNSVNEEQQNTNEINTQEENATI